MKQDEFADVEIIKLRKLYENLASSNIMDIEKDSFLICKKYTGFNYELFYDDTVKILVPSTFAVMPDELAVFRYPTEYRPEVILTSNSHLENLAFTLMDKLSMSPEESIESVKSAISRNTPWAVIYDQDNFTAIDGLEGCWLEYKSFTLVDENYNMQFMVASKTHTLIGAFNCKMRYFEEWKPYVLQILEHISIYD